MVKSTKTRPAYAHEEQKAARTVRAGVDKKKKKGKKKSRGK